MNGEIFENSRVIFLSLIYVVVLIFILLAHEMGHYLACRYYRIDATLPFFIPAPTLIGTMGAFIKIKDPITRKHQLFDIGVAGPLAGFILSVPAVIYGLSQSKAVPALPREESLIFGESLLVKGISVLLFRGIPEDFDIVVHPIAFAGWVGILVTALNLFPIGQLDGGHVLYAVVGQRSQKFSWIILAAFILLGIFFWVGWFVWAVLIKFLGLRHPPISDSATPLSSRRRIVGWVVFFIFIISFVPDPIKGFNFFNLLEQFFFFR